MSEFGRSKWYPYYAGYSPNFVTSVLELLDLGSSSMVVDPWNGSGTTTTVCSLSGRQSAGFDLNPAMVVVAKARLISRDITGSVLSLQRAICADARRLSGITKSDPLLDFFSESSADTIRSLQRSVLRILSDDVVASNAVLVNRFSPLACFYLVALFRASRRLLPASKTKNPTWVKSPKRQVNRFSFNRATLEECLLEECQQMTAALGPSPRHRGSASIKLADSRNLPMDDGMADAVITSPPYCTRIDYAVSTRIELAILGIGDDAGFDALRRSMLGTTLAPRKNTNESGALAAPVEKILRAIRAHASKASGGYYFRTFEDYFIGMARSLTEVARIAKMGAPLVVVAQDSYYKDIHVDLASLIASQAEEIGLIEENRWGYKDSMTMRRVNSISLSSKWLPVESVLLLRKR